MNPSTRAIANALRCGRSGCVCARNGSNKYQLHCPAHNDQTPSLALTESKENLLLHCHAGCEQEKVISALRAKGLWGDTPPTVKVVTPLHSPGLTLAQYADAKKLPMDFLRGLGLADCKYQGLPALRIPYSDASGTLVAVRFRLGLGKDGIRFKWRNGDHPLLYGLDRLNEIRRVGWVLLVEGESDCHTVWLYGIPALGIPGKTNWRAEWMQHLRGLAVFIWQEPDAADLIERVAASVNDLRVIASPAGVKDPSEAHLLRYDVPLWLEALKSQAVPFATVLREKANANLAELRERAEPILDAADPLLLIESEISNLGYGGDIKPALIVYLGATSRLLAMRQGAMPVHLLLLDPPSGGKSYTVSTVRRMLPVDACHVIDAGSPRALIYDDADLRHRVVIFAEADSLPSGEDNPAASAIRNMLQDNHLHYSHVVRDPESGNFKTVEIEKPGPTVVITTAVRRLGEQLMTRLFVLEISDEPTQVQAALRTQAQIETEGTTEADAAFIAFQEYLQLKAPWEVFVPFAPALADKIGKSITAPRINRDFSRLLALIKAVALIRHRHRRIDARDRVIAKIEDYDTVRELVNQMYTDSVGDVTKGVRQVVESVARLRADPAKSSGSIGISKIASALKLSKMAVSRRVKAALSGGWLVNRETRKGYAYDLEVGESLPEDSGLPSADALLDCNTVTPLTDEGDTTTDSRL